MKKIYNKEVCATEALKYNNIADFRKNSPTAYKIICINHWNSEMCSHMSRKINENNYWNYSKCKNEALKFDKKTDFRKNSKGAYSAARLNGWLDEICAHMIKFGKPRGYWTIEKCHEIALMYKTKKDFELNDKTAYKMAHKNGWIDAICGHMKILGNYYKKCIYAYEFSDNHVYIGMTYNLEARNSWRKSCKKDQVTKYIEKSKLTPTKKILTDFLPINDASEKEKYFVEKYRKEGWIVLNKIKAGGTGYQKIIWTYDKCKEAALKYNRRVDFRKKCGGAYERARTNGFLDEICSHMKITCKPQNYWDFESCEKIAKKYKTKSAFKINHPYVYELSRKKGWLLFYY